MKKLMLVLTICFVIVTTVVFFVYPYVQPLNPANPNGVFIRYTEHEYGKEWDTLVITPVNTANQQYQVARRWRYERLLDGKVLAADYKQAKTSLQYLAEEKQFIERESGIRFVCTDGKNELLVGTTIYKKLK